jgi:hypothetical protein
MNAQMAMKTTTSTPLALHCRGACCCCPLIFTRQLVVATKTAPTSISANQGGVMN